MPQFEIGDHNNRNKFRKTCNITGGFESFQFRVAPYPYKKCGRYLMF